MRSLQLEAGWFHPHANDPHHSDHRSGQRSCSIGLGSKLGSTGGNVTGFGGQELSVIGKGLQTLKEIAPNVSRIGIIYNPDNPTGAHFARWFEFPLEPLVWIR